MSIGLTIKLGIASSSVLFAPHHSPAPTASAPVVQATPIASVQGDAPGSGLGASIPPVPAPAPTTTTTTTTAPVDTRQCRVTFAPTVQVDPTTGVSGTYGGGFRGPCVDAYPYAAAFPGSTVTVIPN